MHLIDRSQIVRLFEARTRRRVLMPCPRPVYRACGSKLTTQPRNDVRGAVTVPDGYRRLAVNKQRKFSASFGPTPSRDDDGTTTDFEGSISGRFNKARTKASGKWTFKATDHDAAGATDTCESGSITWTAKQ